MCGEGPPVGCTGRSHHTLRARSRRLDGPHGRTGGVCVLDCESVCRDGPRGCRERTYRSCETPQRTRMLKTAAALHGEGVRGAAACRAMSEDHDTSLTFIV